MTKELEEISHKKIKRAATSEWKLEREDSSTDNSFQGFQLRDGQKDKRKKNAISGKIGREEKEEGKKKKLGVGEPRSPSGTREKHLIHLLIKRPGREFKVREEEPESTTVANCSGVLPSSLDSGDTKQRVGFGTWQPSDQPLPSSACPHTVCGSKVGSIKSVALSLIVTSLKAIPSESVESTDGVSRVFFEIFLPNTNSFIMYKLIVLFAVVAVALCDKLPARFLGGRSDSGSGEGRTRVVYRAPSRGYGSASDERAVYNFNWAVRDDETGIDMGHQEARDGDNTQGSYRVLLPDGRIQTVTYTVDGDSGYLANVQYEGEARFDSNSGESRPSGRYGQPIVIRYRGRRGSDSSEK
ncbi:unnamed protein product [Cyprideis torosa]|uniref:Uncharacterized protein n=1 Tax=Cyprideis torosa TaxID=163714 RepID=A0A7R8ZRT7_9CRUS|nr:unnamed protein product [Cyprideis torosa]CAG0899862.1 unnamed protein product [Cyprideis torosa]